MRLLHIKLRKPIGSIKGFKNTVYMSFMLREYNGIWNIVEDIFGKALMLK